MKFGAGYGKILKNEVLLKIKRDTLGLADERDAFYPKLPSHNCFLQKFVISLQYYCPQVSSRFHALNQRYSMLENSCPTNEHEPEITLLECRLTYKELY